MVIVNRRTQASLGHDQDLARQMQGDAYHARSMNAANLKSAFTAPADFRLESCSPESGLSELDGALELDGLELGPELQFLLESHLSQSPTHSDSHLLDSLDKVRFYHRHRCISGSRQQMSPQGGWIPAARTHNSLPCDVVRLTQSQRTSKFLSDFVSCIVAKRRSLFALAGHFCLVRRSDYVEALLCFQCTGDVTMHARWHAHGQQRRSEPPPRPQECHQHHSIKRGMCTRQPGPCNRSWLILVRPLPCLTAHHASWLLFWLAPAHSCQRCRGGQRQSGRSTL